MPNDKQNAGTEGQQPPPADAPGLRSWMGRQARTLLAMEEPPPPDRGTWEAALARADERARRIVGDLLRDAQAEVGRTEALGLELASAMAAAVAAAKRPRRGTPAAAQPPVAPPTAMTRRRDRRRATRHVRRASPPHPALLAFGAGVIGLAVGVALAAETGLGTAIRRLLRG